MGVASLVLGIISIILGLMPLFPLGPLAGVLTLYMAALGLPIGAVGVCLGLLSRSEALVHQRDPRLHTAGLSSSVIGAMICIAWVGGLFYAQRRLIHAGEACQKDPQHCAPVTMPTHEPPRPP